MDKYTEFVAAVRRDINCLSDRDRMTKKNGLVRLDKTLRKESDHTLVSRLFAEELHKPLLSCFGDGMEKVREVALGLTMHLIVETKIVTGEVLNDVLPLLLAALLGRFRVLPFPESSEELRFRFLECLVELTKLPGLDVSPYSHDLFDGLSKALTDSFPDAKKQACALIADLCKIIPPNKVARSGKLLLPNLLANVQHQHWKVRKSSVECLMYLISASTENYTMLEEIFPILHQLLNDRHPTVRHALAQLLIKLVSTGLTSHWAQERIDFEAEEEQLMQFDRYEHRLLYLLLNSIVDQDEVHVGKPALEGFTGLADLASEYWKKSEVRRLRRAKNMERAQAKVEAQLQAEQVEGGSTVASSSSSTEEEDIDAEVVDDHGNTEEEWQFPDFDSIIDAHALNSSNVMDLKSHLPSVFHDASTSATTVPNARMCFYVARHAERLLPQCLGNLIQWTSDLRIGAARLLKIFLVFLHRNAKDKVDTILVHLYKAIEDEDAAVRKSVETCAQNLSVFLQDPGLIVAAMSKHLNVNLSSSAYLPDKQAAQHWDGQNDEYWGETTVNRAKVRVSSSSEKNKEKPFVAISVENKRQVLKILAQILTVVTYESLSGEILSQVIRFLEEATTLDELLATIVELLDGMLIANSKSASSKKRTTASTSSSSSSSSSSSAKLSVQLVETSAEKKKALQEEWPRLFDILLRCKSSVDPMERNSNPEVAHILEKSDAAIQYLASEICGCDVPDVYRMHLSSQLAVLLENADQQQWPEQSPKRAIFDLLVKNSVHAISPEHLDRIVPVLAKQASTALGAPRHQDDEKEAQGVSARARVDILGILHFLVIQSKQHDVVKQGLQKHALFLFEEMLMPNASWRPGQSHNKIRKATMVCIHQFLELKLISIEDLSTVFPDMLPILKTCMDDSWSPDNRMVATLVVTLVLNTLPEQQKIQDEHLRDLYPELLKRLDDSQDEVRVVTCKAFVSFFRALPEKWSANLYQYILTSLFIHFDDPNPKIQFAVQECLEAALHHNLEVFIQEAEKASPKAVHAKQLEDLIAVAKNLQECG
ncbi:unnamed protein product [Amoebophrya sp. A120]|nr:unnamed protein product [Amoebophrya sp. A120]|eukprot:GSA120T00020303001.1